ncbi:MAG: GNAT family N-acetyltransferase [Anaerolineales bacterium]
MKGLVISFEELKESDIPVVTGVMKCAFDDDAQKHLGEDSGGPPGYDDGEFFRTWLLPYQESVGYRIISDDQVIGAIIVWILPEGPNILGTIFIDPDFQDLGVGQQTWAFIEDAYPETISWRLATPEWATKNHHFYNKCGFLQVDSDPLIPPEEEISIYRKEMV